MKLHSIYMLAALALFGFASLGCQAQEESEAGSSAPPESVEEVEAKAEVPTEPITVPFKVEFECSNGTFVIEFMPEWAPIGVAHFQETLRAGVYDGARFFRVVPGFMVQFGIAGDPALSAKWSNANIMDEPVKESNTRGMVTYAQSRDPNSRSTQLFINYVDNSRLDSTGFAPVDRVISGMEVVDAINAEYGQNPNQGKIQTYGNRYLNEVFPRMDYIKSVKIIVE